MVSASCSRAPRAPQNPTFELPRFTHVAGRNRRPIPIAKASKQELVAGREQYSRKHGKYPDNYPGGPQGLLDGDDESSGDELDVRQDPKTPAHTTNRPLPSTHTLPEVPDSQPPSKRRRYNPSSHSNDSDSRLSTPAHIKNHLTSRLLPQQSYQVSQQLVEEEFQRERERREELHQLEVQERRARLRRVAAADERAAAAQPPPRMTAINDEDGEVTPTEPLTFKVPASFRGKVNAPDSLSATLLWNGLAVDIRKRYQSPIKSYEYFCAINKISPWPASEESLGRWISIRATGSNSLLLRQAKPDTIQGYLSALRSYHIDLRLNTDVFDSEYLERPLKGAKRLYTQPQRRVTPSRSRLPG
jgi:hypothetical protein